MDRREHWESIYSSKPDCELSWTQSQPDLSLALIGRRCRPGGRIIDVGGGISLLVDRLLEQRYAVSVLDISESAISRARARLAESASLVNWIVADVIAVATLGQQDLWHDRAVFHFLTDSSDRRRYSDLLARTVPKGGHAVIATFAPDGPERCSGLDVCRYDAKSLAREIGSGLELLHSVPEAHLAPWGKPQSFQYSIFRRR